MPTATAKERSNLNDMYVLYELARAFEGISKLSTELSGLRAKKENIAIELNKVKREFSLTKGYLGFLLPSEVKRQIKDLKRDNKLLGKQIIELENVKEQYETVFKGGLFKGGKAINLENKLLQDFIAEVYELAKNRKSLSVEQVGERLDKLYKNAIEISASCVVLQQPNVDPSAITLRHLVGALTNINQKRLNNERINKALQAYQQNGRSVPLFKGPKSEQEAQVEDLNDLLLEYRKVFPKSELKALESKIKELNIACYGTHEKPPKTSREVKKLLAEAADLARPLYPAFEKGFHKRNIGIESKIVNDIVPALNKLLKKKPLGDKASREKIDKLNILLHKLKKIKGNQTPEANKERARLVFAIIRKLGSITRKFKKEDLPKGLEQSIASGISLWGTDSTEYKETPERMAGLLRSIPSKSQATTLKSGNLQRTQQSSLVLDRRAVLHKQTPLSQKNQAKGKRRGGPSH